MHPLLLVLRCPQFLKTSLKSRETQSLIASYADFLFAHCVTGAKGGWGIDALSTSLNHFRLFVNDMAFRISIGFLRQFVFILFRGNLQRLSLLSAKLQNSKSPHYLIADVK